MSRLPLSSSALYAWWNPRGRPADRPAGAPPAREVAFDAGATMAFDPSADLRIHCVSGALWVTQAGDGRDFTLAPGDCFVPAPHGRVVVQAVAPARLRTAYVAGDRARVCSWSAERFAR